MNNLKKFATTLTLAGIIMMGMTSAKAGILMSDFTGSNTKTQTCTTFDSGIIVHDVTGIIVSGLTGIIVSGLTGIIVSGASDSSKGCVQKDNGMILSD